MLFRSARTDAAAAPEKRNGRGYRALFQFIKPHLAAAEGGATDDESEDDDEHDD